VKTEFFRTLPTADAPIPTAAGHWKTGDA